MLLKIATGLFPAVLDMNSHIYIFICLGSVVDERTTFGGTLNKIGNTRWDHIMRLNLQFWLPWEMGACGGAISLKHIFAKQILIQFT